MQQSQVFSHRGPNDRTLCMVLSHLYSKTYVKLPLSKSPKIGFQYQLSLNAGQKYCRMLQRKHSAILLSCIKLPIVIKIFVLFIFEWPFYTGFTVTLLSPFRHVVCSLICLFGLGGFTANNVDTDQNCSLRSSLIRVHNVCFHDQKLSEVHLNI